jgi:4-amino-4-deoxychorismate lyase
MTINVLAVLGRGVVDPDTPVAAADDAGLTRGDGCFEGLRLRRLPDGSEIDAIDGHLARMTRSAAGLGLPFDESAWRDLVAEAAAAWVAQQPDAQEAAVKLVLTRGRPGDSKPTGFAIIFPIHAETAAWRRDGIDVVTLMRGYTQSSFADSPWLLGGIKTLSYAVNMAAQREAARRGAHEPLFVTTDGWLLEAPTSSVVWASEHTLRTIADTEANGILHSITVDTLFERAQKDGWTTLRDQGTPADLHAADVVMLVSSVLGPLRVRSLDGIFLPAPAAGLDALAECRRLADFPIHP